MVSWGLEEMAWSNIPDALKGPKPIEPTFRDMKLYMDKAWYNPHRLKCTTALPWLDRHDPDSYIREKGVMCQYCFDKYRVGYGYGGTPLKLPRKAYSYRDYVTHFLGCRVSLERWLRETKDFKAMRLLPNAYKRSPERLMELDRFDTRPKGDN
jgi:hypothetical protein